MVKERECLGDVLASAAMGRSRAERWKGRSACRIAGCSVNRTRRPQKHCWPGWLEGCMHEMSKASHPPATGSASGSAARWFIGFSDQCGLRGPGLEVARVAVGWGTKLIAHLPGGQRTVAALRSDG